MLDNVRAAIAELPKWERPVHLFWLAGPFILLIERSPADIWLTLLALVFALRAIVLREGWWIRTFWVRAAFLFWAVCFVAAAASSLPLYSIGETAAWFRFPLFAMATAFWLGRDPRLLYLMILSTGVGLVMMCGILTAEVIIVGPQGGRRPDHMAPCSRRYLAGWTSGLCGGSCLCDIAEQQAGPRQAVWLFSQLVSRC